MQNDFFTGPLKIKNVKNIIDPLQRLLVAARINQVPVLYSIDAHYPRDFEITKRWGVHAIKGTPGAQVITDLKPDEGKDYIVEKRTYSGFYETGLEPLLRSLYEGEGAKTLILRRFTYQHMHPSHLRRCFFPRLPNSNHKRWRRSPHASRSRAEPKISGVCLQRKDNGD